MNVTDLLSDLARRGADTRAIYTGAGNPEDRYAIVRDGDLWEVYYSERGEQHELRRFSTEAEACEYLRSLLAKDETIWRGGPST